MKSELEHYKSEHAYSSFAGLKRSDRHPTGLQIFHEDWAIHNLLPWRLCHFGCWFQVKHLSSCEAEPAVAFTNLEKPLMFAHTHAMQILTKPRAYEEVFILGSWWLIVHRSTPINMQLTSRATCKQTRLDFSQPYFMIFFVGYTKQTRPFQKGWILLEATVTVIN